VATGNGAAQDVGMVLIYGDNDNKNDPDKNANEKLFGKRLKALRESVGMSQETLAVRAHLAADTVRRAEHGTFSPSLRTLRKLAAGLGIPLQVIGGSTMAASAVAANSARGSSPARRLAGLLGLSRTPCA
jgi:transcriptional regulator with XRE-family HTH domain